MFQGSGGQRVVALPQVIFGAGQDLGRIEELALRALSILGLLRGLTVTAPRPAHAENSDVRSQQRGAYQRPDIGAEAVERPPDHGEASSGFSSVSGCGARGALAAGSGGPLAGSGAVRRRRAPSLA